MQVLYVGAAEGSALSVAACVAGCISVLCGCVSAIQAQLSYWFQLQRGWQQVHPSAWDAEPRSLYSMKPQDAELLEVVTMYNTP